MRLNQVFDDLNDFVATYRGRISRDGILLHTGTLYEEGTVLGVEISLSESLSLIRGTAGVVQLMKGTPETGKPYSAVLEFLQLDENSEAFLDRLAERFEAEGTEPFRLDQVVEKGRRGIRRQSGSYRVINTGSSDAPKTEAASGAASVDDASATAGDADIQATPLKRRTPRPWLLAVFVIVAAAAAATVTVLRVDPIPWLSRATDQGPRAGSRTSILEDDQRASQDASSTLMTIHDDAEPVFPDTPPSGPDHSGLPPATRLESIKWHETDAFTVVTLVANGRIDETSIKHYRMNEVSQSKMVLYLYGVGPGDLSYKTQVDGSQLAAVRVWYHEEESPVQLHIVLDLASQDVVAFKPVVEGHRLVVTLGPRD